MGYLDDFLSYGKKAAEVGLGALEQLNRPAAAVTETVAEAGKAIGRTAGALSSWLSEEEAPQLGEAFTPKEKLAIAKKEDEATAGSVVSEALTGLGKTAIAPVAGFIKNKRVSEILAEKQGTPTDTVTEATKSNVSAIQEAKKSPEALAQIKKEGGLPVNAQETWSEFLKEPSTRGLLEYPAMALDPLFYGAGIGAKTAKGIEAAKTTEGMAPTLLGQFAEGERTAVGLGKLKEGGVVSDTINSAINKLQQASDYMTEAIAGKTKTGIERLASNYEWVDKSLEVADSARKALFNRSKNPDYNQIQELLVNNGKTKVNTADSFLKDIELSQVGQPVAHPEELINGFANAAVDKTFKGTSPYLEDSILFAQAPLLRGETKRIYAPTVVDIINNPTPSLRNIMENFRAVKDYLVKTDAIEAFDNYLKDPAFRNWVISDDVLATLKAKGYVTQNTTLKDLYTTEGAMNLNTDKIYEAINPALKFIVNYEGSKIAQGSEAVKNEALDYILSKTPKTDSGLPLIMNISEDVLDEARNLNGWNDIQKYFNPDTVSNVAPNKLLNNLITPEIKEQARKLKQNVSGLASNLLKSNESISNIKQLNEAMVKKYPDLTKDGALLPFSEDPVKILASYGLGLGDNKWKNNIYGWVIKKANEGSDVVKAIPEGAEPPTGYVSLWREKLPDYAIKEDVYKPLSDSLGKIVGTPDPGTIIENFYDRYMQLWKKSVLTGLIGEGYGYAVRNITSETLKTAQSGINTLPEMTKTALGHIDAMANKIAESIPMFKNLPKLTAWAKPMSGASRSVLEDMPWMVKTADGGTIDAYNEAKKLGVIDSGFFAEEIFKGGEISDKIKIRMLPATEINKARAEYRNIAGGKRDEDFAQAIADYHGVDVNTLLQESDVPKAMIPVADKTGLVGYLESSDLLGAGMLANNSERTARLTTFGKAIEDGYTPEAAARLVGETSFNYADISNEAKTMKKVIPFLTFYLKNIPFQLGKFVSEPKVQRYLQHGLELTLPSKEELAKMPDYEKERLPLNVNVPIFGGTGMRQYLAQFQGLGLAQEIKEGKLGKAVEEGLKDVVSAVNPLMRLAIELGTGTTVPGSRTTPLGATGGNILGMDRPIERYTGEKGALFLPNPITGLTVPVPKKVEYAVETLVPPLSKLNKLAELGETKGKEGVGKQLLRYTTGVGATEPKTPKEIRRAERSEKIAIQQDIRKSRVLLRRYKKDLKDNKISQQQFDSHKEALKNLEVELKKAYRTKKPLSIQEGSPVSNMLNEIKRIEVPEEVPETETTVSPLRSFFETPIETESPIKPSIIQEFTAPEIKKVSSPIDDFINSEYNNTGDDNMSKEVADKAINFALRNEDDSYDKNAKLENLRDGAGLTFIGLTEKYDEAHLKNKYGVTIKQLADMYKSDKTKALDIIKDTYRDLYWNEAFDGIKDEKLAIRLFDLMLNRGAGGLRSILSNAGYKLENLNDYIDKQGKDTVYNNVVDSAEELYRGLKNFNKFGNGWLNRLKRSEYTV